MFTARRRPRVAFLPSLEALTARITPSDVMPPLMTMPPTSPETSTQSYDTTTSCMPTLTESPIEPPSSDIQPSDVPSTYYGASTAPPMFPPPGTPGTTYMDYIIPVAPI